MDRKTFFFLALPVAALLFSSCGKPMNLAGRTQTASSVVSLDGNLTVSSQNESSAVFSAISSATSASSAIGAKRGVSAGGADTAVTNGLNYAWQPTMIRYQHRLYKMDADFPAAENYYAQGILTTPGNKICTFSQYQGKVTAYTVRSEKIQKSLCISNGWEDEPNSYSKFSCLCEDEISVPGRSYRITGGDMQLLDCPSSDSAENSAKIDYTMAFNYYCHIPRVLQNIRQSLDTKLGTTAFGATVYQITDIDPTDAVYMNLGSDWFLITRKGYVGADMNIFRSFLDSSPNIN